MMRERSWELPRACPSSNCSSPSTRAPRLADQYAAALPMTPRPKTATSYSRGCGCPISWRFNA